MNLALCLPCLNFFPFPRALPWAGLFRAFGSRASLGWSSGRPGSVVGRWNPPENLWRGFPADSGMPRKTACGHAAVRVKPHVIMRLCADAGENMGGLPESAGESLPGSGRQRAGRSRSTCAMVLPNALLRGACVWLRSRGSACNRGVCTCGLHVCMCRSGVCTRGGGACTRKRHGRTRGHGGHTRWRGGRGCRGCACQWGGPARTRGGQHGACGGVVRHANFLTYSRGNICDQPEGFTNPRRLSFAPCRSRRASRCGS